MSILQAVMTAPLMGSGPRVTWASIDYASVNEGQQNTVYLNFENWDNTSVYWYLVDANNNQITGQTSSANAGSFSPGTGNYTNYASFNFTFSNDATTEGSLEYYIRLEDVNGNPLMARQGAYTVNDTSFNLGTLLVNGSSLAWGSTNSTTPTYAAYTFPDTSTGSVHTFDGTKYVLTSQYGVAPTLTFNLWFYPTSNLVSVISELGQPTENSGWHYNMLEIDNDGKLKGRVWAMGVGANSVGSVNLNAWNHVHFYYDHATTTFGISLNNETPVTSNVGGVRLTSDTNATYWGIGLTDTNPVGYMVTGARYQGKFDILSINDSITGSNYNTTKAKYGF